MPRGNFFRFKASSKRLLGTLALAAYLLLPASLWACTTIVVGKDASATGNILLARTEDYYPTAAKRFVVYPAGYYKRGETLRDTNDFEYVFTHDSYKFTGTPDMLANGGELYDAHGTNEHGLAVSATNTTDISEKLDLLDPLVGDGIQEAILPSVLLGEAKTALEAITLAGSLVESHGASEGFLFVAADQEEAWIFETVSGHRWVASRVPDDSFAVVANDMVTEHVALSDGTNYRGTSDVISYAKENDFGVTDGTGEVNIAASYGSGTINEEGNAYRRWRGYNLYAPSKGIEVRTPDDLHPYATFVKPDGKIGVTDIMLFQRDRYQGTQYDQSESAQVFNPSNGREVDGGQPRSIGVAGQQETHIYEMVKGYPAEIGARWWMATAQSEHSVYLPFYGAITDTHPYFQKQAAGEAYEPDSTFWIFQDLAFKARGNRAKYGKPIQSYWRDYELKLYSEQPEVERELLSAFARDKAAGRKMITDYTTGTTQAALNRAAQIREALIAHVAVSPDERFTVPSDLTPYANATPVIDLTLEEIAAVAELLGLDRSQTTVASLGLVDKSEIGWESVPEIAAHTPLSTPGIVLEAQITAGNVARIIYSAELKGDDYAKFGNSIENVKNQFAFFRSTPVPGESDVMRQLVGPAGLVSLPDAIAAGMASVFGTKESATVTIRYYLCDVGGEPKYGKGVLAVPDGNTDDSLSDRLWAERRTGGSGGTSGGCETGAAGAMLFCAAAVSFVLRGKKS